MFHANNSKRLTITAIAFVLIIIVGLITMHKPEHIYKLNPADLVESIMMKDGELTPGKAVYYAEESNPDFVFIDIRNQYEFIKGHIPNAINIPLTELLSKATLKQFDKYSEDSVTIVIYGNSQTDANAPWMILKQLAYPDVKILLGGFDYYSKDHAETGDTAGMPEYYVEIPKYDYAAIAAETSSGDVTGQDVKAEPVLPVRKKKKTVASGGC